MERARYRQFVSDSARWDGFEFRPDDILICTPPKCGTTWMQRILAALVFGSPELPAPLSDLSPWLDMQVRPLAEVVANLDAQTHRRFIKTHTPLDGLPWRADVHYIVVGRDPGAVALSIEDHRANADVERVVEHRREVAGLDDLDEIQNAPEFSEDPAEMLCQWRDDETDWRRGDVTSMAEMVAWLDTGWQRRHEPNVTLVHYSDLVSDLETQMRRVADRLGLVVPAQVWPSLVNAATFDSMKQDASALAPEASLSIWKNDEHFFRVGAARDWRGLLDSEQTALFLARLDHLAGPDLASWMLHGAGQGNVMDASP